MRITINTTTNEVEHIETCCKGMANMVYKGQIHINEARVTMPGRTPYPVPYPTPCNNQPAQPYNGPVQMAPSFTDEYTMDYCPKCGHKIEISVTK